MAVKLAPKIHHSLAKSLTKIHSYIKLSGALLMEDGQTTKTGRGSSRDIIQGWSMEQDFCMTRLD